MSVKNVLCPFDPLNGHSSLGIVRCLCVLFFSFVNVVRFSCVNRHSCVGLCGTRVTGLLVSSQSYNGKRKEQTNKQNSNIELNNSSYMYMGHT